MSFFKKLLSKSKTLNSTIGKVVYDTPKILGQISSAYIQVRLMEKLNHGDYVIGIKFKPDMYAGPDGSPTNYLNLDIEKAKQLSEHLDRCISRYERLVGNRD